MAKKRKPAAKPAVEDNEMAQIQALLWASAREARKSEVMRSLKDSSVWRQQMLSLTLGVLKAGCIGLLVNYILLEINLPAQQSTTVAVVLALIIYAWNPGLWFRKNLFRERGHAASVGALVRGAQDLKSRMHD